MNRRRMNQYEKSMLCIEVRAELKEAFDIYIYGTNKESAGLFFLLCSWHIPVRGFVDEKYDEVGMFFHKPIFAVKDIPKDSTIVSPREKVKNWENCITSENVIGINHNINRKNVVIYGCGKVGRQLKKYLEIIGVSVKCYIETNSEKIGTEIDGVTVYGKEKLELFEEGTSVIAAGLYWKEINNIIQKTNAKLDRYYLSNCVFLDCVSMPLDYGGGVIIDFEKNIRISCFGMFALEEHFADKEIVLYGSEIDVLKKYAEMYLLLGYSKISIAIDNEIIIDNKTCLVSIIDIVDVLCKEDYIILLQDRCKIKKLEELGLKASKDFVMISLSAPDNPYRESVLDINLGYTYIINNFYDNYQGIHIYGENKEDDFRIAVFGDSTSESDRSYIKGWVENLFNKYLNVGVTIYNCAMTGYSSEQYLIKLMRDGLLLKPDLILVYGYTNDCTNIKTDGIFEFPYLRSLFDQLSSVLNKKVVTGQDSKNDVCWRWLYNIRYMNAIAQINNAKLYAFIQPMLVNKDNYTFHEKKMMKMINVMYPEEVLKRIQMFKERAKKMAASYSYIYDLTNIFDKEDVYMDHCHVYEQGNQIIADSIWNVIKEAVPECCKI